MSVWVHVARPLRVLVLRRVAARAAGWQPVTGRVEPGESDEDACRREVVEETGLSADGALADLAREATFVGYDGATYRQRAYALRVPRPDAARPRPDEHEDARWLDADAARALLRWDEDKASLDALRARMEAQ